jgi:hypothetical protein
LDADRAVLNLLEQIDHDRSALLTAELDQPDEMPFTDFERGLEELVRKYENLVKLARDRLIELEKPIPGGGDGTDLPRRDRRAPRAARGHRWSMGQGWLTFRMTREARIQERQEEALLKLSTLTHHAAGAGRLEHWFAKDGGGSNFKDPNAATARSSLAQAGERCLH